MKSFFTRIQNKFSATYGGRYIETILEEISKHDSYLIKNLFPELNEKCHIELEYYFESNGNNRIADIAIMSNNDQQILALVEIKYDDHKNKKNYAQIKDYIYFCNKNRLQFQYLTQYYPPQKDLDLLSTNGFSHLLFSDFAMRINKKNSSELSTLFVDFLKDKGLMMEQISPEYIGKLLVRLFNPYSGQKIHNNNDMIHNIPESFAGVMTNINVISQELNQYLLANRMPAIDFHVNPIFNISKKNIRDILDENNSRNITYQPSASERFGGEFYIYARSTLKNKSEKYDWFNIEFGFCFTIEIESKEHITELYTTITGRHISGDHYKSKKIGNTVISNKSKCIEYFKSLLLETTNSAETDSKIKKIHIKQIETIKDNIKR